MVHYHHFRVIALNVILLEVFIVKNDPSQNSKEKQISKKWQDEKLGCLVEHLCKGMLEINNAIKYFTHFKPLCL